MKDRDDLHGSFCCVNFWKIIFSAFRMLISETSQRSQPTASEA